MKINEKMKASDSCKIQVIADAGIPDQHVQTSFVFTTQHRRDAAAIVEVWLRAAPFVCLGDPIVALYRNTIFMKIRCPWPGTNPLYIKYHDLEWGVPLHDDRRLFEFLLLEGFQAGLSWITILKKRTHYREAFDHFDPHKVAAYDNRKVKELLANPGVVRNKLKIETAIQNAKFFLDVQKEFGSFDNYIWQFTNGTTNINAWKTLSQIPAKTNESIAMSNDLKKKGFKFVGPTICYAFMQAVGMVNDHLVSCFRYHQIKATR